MYWIIVIIAAILAKIIYDRYAHLEKINSNGGLIVRYKTLIEHFMAKSKGKITRKGKDHINIDYYGTGVSAHFCILPAFDDVIITWEFKCQPIGVLKNKWEFNENKISQAQMIAIIDKDIELQSQPFLEVIGGDLDSEIENIENSGVEAKAYEIIKNNPANKEQAEAIIYSRRILYKPGKYKVKVTDVLSWENLYGGKIFQIGYDATTDALIKIANESIDVKDFENAIKYNLASRHIDGNETSMNQNEHKYLPIIGEEVTILVDYDNGDKYGLKDELKVLDWYPI